MRDNGLKVGDKVPIIKFYSELTKEDWGGMTPAPRTYIDGRSTIIIAQIHSSYPCFRFIESSGYWYPIAMIYNPIKVGNVVPNGLFKKLKTNNGKI